jgi:hypothetical protein
MIDVIRTHCLRCGKTDMPVAGENATEPVHDKGHVVANLVATEGRAALMIAGPDAWRPAFMKAVCSAPCGHSVLGVGR